MAVRPHLLSLVPIAAVSLGLALSGCTPLGTFVEFGEPRRREPHRIPRPHSDREPRRPEPTTGECDDPVLVDPGEYHLPDCVRLTIEGHDIEVHAGSVGTLIIDGDANDVSVGDVGSLSIIGSVNEVDTLDLATLDLNGRFNWIGVHGSVDRVADRRERQRGARRRRGWSGRGPRRAQHGRLAAVGRQPSAAWPDRQRMVLRDVICPVSKPSRCRPPWKRACSTLMQRSITTVSPLDSP